VDRLRWAAGTLKAYFYSDVYSGEVPSSVLALALSMVGVLAIPANRAGMSQNVQR
jgi:hypothetical protein